MGSVRRAFISVSIGWAVLLPLVSFAASQPAPPPAWYALAFVVYGAGGIVCHQLPARSFSVWSAPMPVCARCTGIYFGAALSAVVAVVRLWRAPLRSSAAYDAVGLRPDTTHNTAHRARMLLAAGVLPNAATLVYEWTTGDAPSNVIRALAGAPLGATIVVIILAAWQDAARRRGTPHHVRSGVN